jgi:hypothetical protein
MTKNQKIISALNSLWCKCVAGYHKSCDVTHYITQKYTFGDLTYSVEHGAYIGEDIEGTFSTLEAAESFLIQKMVEAIKEEVKWNLDVIELPVHGESEVNDKNYWLAILEELNKLDIIEEDKVNWQEQALKMERDFYYLKNAMDYATEKLNEFKVPSYDKEYPEMEYSIGHRISILGNKK